MYMCLFYLHNFDGCLAGGVGVRIICGGLDSATLGAFFFLRMADGAESLSSSESDDSDSNSCCLCAAFCDGLKQKLISVETCTVILACSAFNFDGPTFNKFSSLV